MKGALLAVALAVATPAVSAERSRAMRAEFQRSNPCPSTGAMRGACPGYQMDHRIALCAGGTDRAGNLQWLRVDEHMLKTKEDVTECRSSGR